MTELLSTRFPFAIGDLLPSPFAAEFVYASPQDCSLYSIDKGTTTRSIHITDTSYIQTNPVSLQSSSNPLVYYLSHPDGIRICDFRKKKSNVLTPAERCVFLERIDEDWNTLIACFEDEINVIDIRNPKSLLLRWRYSGQVRKIECRRCPSEYNIHWMSRNDSLYDTVPLTEFTFAGLCSATKSNANPREYVPSRCFRFGKRADSSCDSNTSRWRASINPRLFRCVFFSFFMDRSRFRSRLFRAFSQFLQNTIFILSVL